MLNEKSIEAVDSATFSQNFRRPLYESYCFSQIPQTILSLFIENQDGLPPDTYQKGPYENVILLFIDAFGWKFFEKYKSSLPFLQKMEKEGICSKLTSMFPSTTAAHVTCINTGLPPNRSGLYEWFLYEPKLNDIIAPLSFNYAGERKIETLPLNPNELYPLKTLYQDLEKKGIRSVAFQPHSIVDSPYTKTVLNGAQIFGYKNPQEGLEELAKELKGSTYAYFYFGDVDAIGHRKGIDSKDFAEEIEKIFAAINNFAKILPTKTALIITADHGMVSIDPETTYYLNKKVPNIEKYLKFGARNKPLTPAGSCRDYFLHVQENSLHELRDILKEFLEGKGEVYFTQDLLDLGFFGPGAPSENFTSRVGNLAILSYEGESIWWWEKGRFQQNFHGAHGGLTPGEMEIPFLFMPF